MCASVSLVMQHAKRMRRIILSSAARPALPYFSTLSPKRHDLPKKVTEYKLCVVIFSTTFASNISHSKQNSADDEHTSSSKASVIPAIF